MFIDLITKIICSGNHVIKTLHFILILFFAGQPFQDKNDLIIIAGGDVNLITKRPDYLASFSLDKNYYFQELLPVIRQGDIRFCNFEQTVSDETPFPKPYPGKPFVFMGPGEHLDVIKNAGFNVFCLANNHILDYGRKGLELTLQAFERRALKHFGAGLNEEDAKKPLIIEIKGRKVAFLGYIQRFPQDFHARGNREGCPAYMKYSSSGYSERINRTNARTEFFFKEDIEKIRRSVDLVVVSLHFGPEYLTHPAPYQVQTARAAVDAGADIVLGHHPHVIQKFERYKDGLIFYSLGNLVFPSYFSDPFIMLAEIRISGKKSISGLKIHPFVVKNLRDVNLRMDDYVMFKPVPASGRWLMGYQYMLKERDMNCHLLDDVFYAF